ncbi:MAG: aldehyde ferredoxin oxidoreductase C-terminal domain-containing protein [Clostridium fessum]
MRIRRRRCITIRCLRTWFGLLGLCKLPWNDIVPADNSLTDEPAKVPEHVDNYLDLYYGVTGVKIDRDDMIKMSERVYNFQRIFNIRLGKGLRANDAISIPLPGTGYGRRISVPSGALRWSAGRGWLVLQKKKSKKCP